MHILGCGCAMPTTRHLPSAQVINVRGKLSLIDCGEGTQLQMRRQGISFMKIRNVFLSHLHGDHCLGLPGLISTFGMLGRTADFHVYAPAEYENMLRLQLDFFCHGLEFEVVFHAVDTTAHLPIYEDRSVTVWSLPLNHRVPCAGFLFQEKPLLPHIRRDMIDFYGIPVSQIASIKNGVDWEAPDGRVIPNALLTRPADKPRSYAYCSDTAFQPDLIEYLHGVTLLYHEATFGKDYEARAKETLHSTAADAARLAKECEAKKLIIGHYSAHYPDETVLLKEAQEVFPNTIGAEEGMVVKL